MSGLGPSFLKIWTCGSSPRSGSRNVWRRIKNVKGISRLSNIWNFFGAIQMISCRSRWPWTKPGFIAMTRRQSNNQLSGGIAAHPAPKYSECKNSLEKFAPRFFGIKTASSLLIIFQRANLSTRSIAHLWWCDWRSFWRKNAAGRSPGWSCSRTSTPRLTGHLQPRRNWSTCASIVLITQPILRIWPRRTTTCSLDWKNHWKVAIFLPTRKYILGYCSTGRRKIEEFHSYKIFFTRNDRSHSDFHPGMAVLGFEIRLPCYKTN